MKKKQKYYNLPPVRVPSEDFLLACRTKSDATGVPLAFVQRRALEDWLEGRYDPTHEVTTFIFKAENAKPTTLSGGQPYGDGSGSTGTATQTGENTFKVTPRSIRLKGDNKR